MSAAAPDGQGGGSTQGTGDGTGATTGNSFLPGHLIPPFKPGETDVNEYTRRIEFLAGIWPAEHLPLLAQGHVCSVRAQPSPRWCDWTH